MAAVKRIYVVTNSSTGATSLVRAINQQQAKAHAAAGLLTVSVASQDDLVTLVGRGVAVEEAVPPNLDLPLEPQQEAA